MAFIDIKVFIPYVQSNATIDLCQMYTSHENNKKLEYNVRILQVKKATLSSAVFSCNGGELTETNKLPKTITENLSLKLGKNTASQSIPFTQGLLLTYFTPV